MSRYYTPRLEEFHAKFEYEVYIPDTETWSKEVFFINEDHIAFVKYVDVQDENTEWKVRVKYLDQHDVESLKFTYIDQPSKSIEEEFRKYNGPRPSIQQYIMNNGRYWVHLNVVFFSYGPVVRIETSVEKDSVKTLVIHSMSVKNISELKFLLNRNNLL